MDTRPSTTTNPTTNPTTTAPAPADHHASTGGTAHYLEPDVFTRRVFNPIVSRLTGWGIGVWGSRILSVPGRVSGEVRSTPVNVLTIDGHRYLVAPRGRTQWVLNVRAAGSCTLRVGRRVETVEVRELDDAAKPPILRAYLRRWKWEVGQFFDGVGPDSTTAELLAIAANHPVFEIRSI